MKNTPDDRATDVADREPENVRAGRNEEMVGRADQPASSNRTVKVSADGNVATSPEIPYGGERRPPYPSLLGDNGTSEFRRRWSEIQAAFVDEPRNAVQRADALVVETTKRLTQVFADQREELERQWERGDDVTTEDLRLALQRYRSFFDRLLSI